MMYEPQRTISRRNYIPEQYVQFPYAIELAGFNNKASLCYDGVIVNLRMLVAHRCRMPFSNDIQTHGKKLLSLCNSSTPSIGQGSFYCRPTTAGLLLPRCLALAKRVSTSPAIWLFLVEVIPLHTLDHLIPEIMVFELYCNVLSYFA